MPAPVPSGNVIIQPTTEAAILGGQTPESSQLPTPVCQGLPDGQLNTPFTFESAS